ncbi:hypothetical protein AQUSIP_08710 [Aquicella siphonis]|uniref:Uncharacterized protein n=1 Tax=Aquicella siphonis TaxID=254247 RepID=A0A5E4PGY9_9COXI|nr:hypothetical protein [Aquicella siphonis]VVC75581.1 hypothetical protein AQUSIP_08710 [Aquicella siphonis]
MSLPRVIQYDAQSSPRRKIHFPVGGERAAEFAGVNPLTFAPITHMTRFSGRDMYFSDVYYYKGYPVVFGYVEEGDQLQPRLFYFSKSHAVWRVAPAVEGKFGKAYEEFSCDLPPLLNLAMMQTFQDDVNASRFAEMKNIEAFVDAFTCPFPGRHTERPREFDSETAMPNQGIFEIDVRDRTIGYLKNNRQHVPTRVEADDLPDLDSGVDFSLKTRNPFYERYLISGNLTVCSCLSFNGNYRYLFAEGRDQDGQLMRFLLTAAPEPPGMNSFGVAAKQAYLGYAHVTPLMRLGEWRRYAGVEGEIIEHARGRGLSTEFYLNVAGYAAALPINDLLQHPEKIRTLRSDGTLDVLQPEKKLARENVRSAPASSSEGWSDEEPELPDARLEDLIDSMSGAAASLKERKARAVVAVAEYLKMTNRLDDLLALLNRLKSDERCQFLRKERHFFRAETFANTATWNKIVGMIKEKAFAMVKAKSALSADEIAQAFSLFDEQRGRTTTSVTRYHEDFEQLLRDRSHAILSRAPKT